MVDTITPPLVDPPLTLWVPPALSSDEAFFQFCQRNRDLRIERNVQGELIIMSPASSSSSHRNLTLAYHVYMWAVEDGMGIAFDSSAGFILPNGAVRSPDVAWVRRERLAQLTEAEKARFLPLCPDFVIELRSPTDRLRLLQAKMTEYMENGAALGWLIDPQNRTVWVYVPDADPVQLDNPAELHGDLVLPNLTVSLASIWKKPF